MTNSLIPTVIILLAATSSCLVESQFLQPQSHLGRLVQSITSPLVLSSSSNGDSDSYADPSRYFPSGSGQDTNSADSPAQGRQGSRQVAALQQAPSQQRGIPQRYYGQSESSYGNQHQQGDEDQGVPTNNRHKEQEYQMGAYLGPTIDDKEINGAFNSNDDRDEDDGPASFDGPTGGEGPRYKAASNSYGSDSSQIGYGQGAGSNQGYGPSSGSDYDGRQAGSSYGPNQGTGGYEEDSADEDEAPNGRERARGRQYRGLNQAASQYQQQGAQYGAPSGRNQANNGQMMAAANGYAPYGYANGPIDITGIVAGMAGNPNSGYEVYNGDGSYPGGYGGQRGGRRNQAASMNQNGYYNPDGSYGPQRANNNDNDDQDMDGDDD